MTEHKRRDAALQIKAVDEEKRQFTGLASTWEKDLGGDVITKGAFAKTLNEWRANGKVLPLLDSHKYGSISAVLGKMVEAKETDAGLEATFQLRAGPQGEEAWDLVREGYVDGLSIGYEARAWEKPDDEEKSEGVHRKLTEINLVEVSLVQMPMNQGARIAAVKSALDSMQPEDMSDEDRRTLRELAGRIGALLRPQGSKSEPEPVGDEPEPEAEPEAKQDPQDPDPTPEPSADSEGEADAAPEHVREALLERLGRINKTPKEEESDDE
jgi:uncharacterized protein